MFMRHPDLLYWQWACSMNAAGVTHPHIHFLNAYNVSSFVCIVGEYSNLKLRAFFAEKCTSFYKCSAVSEMGDRLATMDMSRKFGR